MAPRDQADGLQMFTKFGPVLGILDVPDPYGGPQPDYERALDLIEAGCKGLPTAADAGRRSSAVKARLTIEPDLQVRLLSSCAQRRISCRPQTAMRSFAAPRSGALPARTQNGHFRFSSPKRLITLKVSRETSLSNLLCGSEPQ